MNRYAAGTISAVVVASVGFAIHVGSQSAVQAWVDAHASAQVVVPSWDVRYLAYLTSLEVGVGLVVLYSLVRSGLPSQSSIVRGLLVGVLLLAVMGRLFRQPAMNLAIGNPPSVVLVQDGVGWLTWLAMGIAVAVTLDWLSPPPHGL